MQVSRKLLAAVSAAQFLLLTAGAESVDESVDYIVIGGGTSGLLLANRLSREKDITVTVVDPGSDERHNPLVYTPNDWFQVTSSYIAERHITVKQTNANNRKLTAISGKGIGGTSLINGMTYIRGDAPQFDSWERLGNKGWNWNTMLKYYKKLEGFIPPQEWQVEAGATFNTEFHGTGGDIHTCFNPELLNGSFYDAAIDGWASLGYAKIKDANAGFVNGFDVWPQTIDAKTNKRWDAASAFYWPIYQKRKNLKLINGTVTRILWDDKRTSHDKARAVGIQYTTASDDVVHIAARKEIILAAGALNTPLILENSGVGQAALLESRGIPVIVDLPGVGENLVDNPLIAYVYQSDMNLDGYTPYATFITAHELFGDQTASKASSTKAQLSQWAQTVVERSGGALNVSAVEHLMAIQHELIFKKNVTIAEIVQLAAPGALAASAWDLLPFSRGSIHVSASNGIDNTDFDPQFLAVDFDIEKQLAMGKLVRSFYATDKIRPYVAGYLDPSADTLPENATDDEWRKFVPNAVNPNNHALGTASMMARELGGVVDSKLRVYGISNVRVVDASVVPTQISGHLTATIYVIAERASEMILRKF